MNRSGYLYLSLALACFVGILGIFVVDVYLGVHDTLFINYQEYENRIEFDDQPYYETGGTYYWGEIIQGEPVHFRYRIDNRTFSPRSDQLRISLWKDGNRVMDVLNRQVNIPSFGDTVVEWDLSIEEFAKADLASEEYANYTMKISFAGKERSVVFGYRTRSTMPPPKPVPGV